MSGTTCIGRWAPGIAIACVLSSGSAAALVWAEQTAGTGQSATSGQATPRPATTVIGCVRPISDQTNVFALEVRTDGASANEQATGTTGSAATAGGASSTAAPKAVEGSWYRLTGSEEYLKRYAGQRVRVHGTVRPGRNAQGVDVLVHEFKPKSTVVTAVDVQPAPQIEVDTVSPASGTCTPAQ